MENSKTLQNICLFVTLLISIIVLNYFFLGSDSVMTVRGLIISILMFIVTGYAVISKLSEYNNSYGTAVSGLIVGGLFFVSVLGIKIVNPTNISWLMQGDWGTHFLGWHFFRDEPWGFPFGMLKNYQYPVGTAVALTDANPLMAFILKPFTNILPHNFQYIGFWLLLCFCLQGLFGALLIRSLSNNIIIQLSGSAFFVVSPILLNRIGHPTLCSHWILLGALWLYFRNKNKSPSFPDLGMWLFFTITSASVQPYISPMLLGMALAFYLRLVLVDNALTVKHSILNISILIFSTLAVWWAFGFFELGQPGNYMGMFAQGHYSMNLIAPINPSDIWSPVDWSIFLKSWPLARGGQYEGFNYFGIGVILLGSWVCYALLTAPPKFKTIKFFLPLAVVCICFTIFAINIQVTIGDKIIFQYPTISQILSVLSIFRTPGRFFWPVYYSILFLIIAFLIRRSNNHLTLALILITGLSLQLLDFHKKYEVYNKTYCQPSKNWNNPLTSDFWDAAGEHYEKIILVPPGKDEAAPYLPFAYLAANNGMAINTSYSSRYKRGRIDEYRNQLLADIKNGVTDSTSIYILTEEYRDILQSSARTPIICRTIDGFNVCVSDDL